MSERLLEAVRKDNLQLIKQYLDEGDDIHYKNDSVLIWAITYGYFDIVKFLIKKGINIHKSALNLALTYGYGRIATFLVKNGASVHVANKESIIATATLLGHKDLVEHFLGKSKAKL